MCEQFGGLGSAACRSVTVSGLLCISDLPTELFQSTAQKPCGRPSGVRFVTVLGVPEGSPLHFAAWRRAPGP
jgi:hypothetical protein